MAAVWISCYLCQRKDFWTSVTAYNAADNANFTTKISNCDGEGPSHTFLLIYQSGS